MSGNDTRVWADGRGNEMEDWRGFDKTSRLLATTRSSSSAIGETRYLVKAAQKKEGTSR